MKLIFTAVLLLLILFLTTSSASASYCTQHPTSPKCQPPPPTTLWKATGLHVTSVASNSVGLDWDSDPSGTRLNYWSYTYNSSGTLLKKVNEATSSTTITGLTACTSYTFRVSAQFSTGEGPLSDPVSATTTCSQAIGPNGPPGTWTLTFADEFDGTTLDTNKWTNSWFNESVSGMNGVQTLRSNVSVANGQVALQLSDSTHGALIHTDGDSITGRAAAVVGGVVEARCNFAGNGTYLYNWPAFWANSTVNYPAAGENDIAEVLSPGVLTVNYHSPSGSHNQGAPAGYWGGALHTYTLYRKSTSSDVYWDGVLVKSYPTDDNGNPEDIILNMGIGKGPTQLGSAGALRCDYVRTYRPA